VTGTGENMATDSRLPKYVIEGYWMAVRKCLRSRHDLSLPIVSRTVRIYRTALEKSGIGEEIYHEPVEETAQGIIDGGYIKDATPKHMTNGRKGR
jgi:hypothetical protein